jgi:hypothetical protein
MNKILALICLSFCFAGQKPQIINPKPYGEGPDYSVTQPNFVYGGEYTQFHDVDLKNFVLHSFDEKNRHEVCGQLHKGRWGDREKFGAGMESLTWRHTYALSSGSQTSQYAMVYFDYFGVGGSSDSDGYAQVWQLQDKKLTVVQQIQFNTHFDGPRPVFIFKPQGERLTVRASHYLPGDPHCRISAFDELTFRWEDGLFKLVKKETKPTHTGPAH